MIPKEALSDSQRVALELEVTRTPASERGRLMSQVLSSLSFEDLSFEELSPNEEKFQSVLRQAINRRDKTGTHWQVSENRRAIELQELRDRQREARRQKEAEQQKLRKPSAQRAKQIQEVGMGYDKVWYALLDHGPMTAVAMESLGLTDNPYGFRSRETSLHQVLGIWRKDLGIVEFVPPQAKPNIYKFAVGALDKFEEKYGRLPALLDRELTEAELRRFGR